jgi:hypothetical protein
LPSRCDPEANVIGPIAGEIATSGIQSVTVASVSSGQ